jgi:hypothetical protein
VSASGGGYLSQHYENLFEIDRDTGLIKLQPGVRADQDLTSDYYNVTVVATDDGSCCNGQAASEANHSSRATVVISVTDVNNHKPVFDKCEEYSTTAKIREGRHRDVPVKVLTVVATDADSHRNGEVVYSLYYPKGEARKPFVVDPTTGELTASPYHEFDRETRPFEDVTVKATDRGERPLIGFCQLKVEVIDVNDNKPQFERSSYETSVHRKSAVGTSVVTVFADDRDAPANAKVTYELLADTDTLTEDLSYFRIGAESGELIVVQQLPVAKHKFQLVVRASDNGTPTPQTETVSVTVHVTESAQSAPVWQQYKQCPPEVVVDETVAINTAFFTCFALPHDDGRDGISYSMANGVKAGTNADYDFREFAEKRADLDWVVVRNLQSLDYEKTKEYNLTLTATDMRNGVSADKILRVRLRDKNDEVPRFKLDKFTGQVEEEAMPNSSVVVALVEATDGDSPNTNASRIVYDILPGPASPLFRINKFSGEIFAMQKFDRELNDTFILDVQASDSIKSDLPGMNSNPNRGKEECYFILN